MKNTTKIVRRNRYVIKFHVCELSIPNRGTFIVSYYVKDLDNNILHQNILKYDVLASTRTPVIPEVNAFGDACDWILANSQNLKVDKDTAFFFLTESRKTYATLLGYKKFERRVNENKLINSFLHLKEITPYMNIGLMSMKNNVDTRTLTYKYLLGSEFYPVKPLFPNYRKKQLTCRPL